MHVLVFKGNAFRPCFKREEDHGDRSGARQRSREYGVGKCENNPANWACSYCDCLDSIASSRVQIVSRVEGENQRVETLLEQGIP